MNHAEWWARKQAALEKSLADATLTAEAAKREAWKLPGLPPFAELGQAEEELRLAVLHAENAAWENVADIRARLKRHAELEQGTELVHVDRPNAQSQSYVIPSSHEGDPSQWGMGLR